MGLGDGILCSVWAGVVECLVHEGASFVGVPVEGDIAVFVLELVGVTITMADVDADDHTIDFLFSWKEGLVLEFLNSLLDVV